MREGIMIAIIAVIIGILAVATGLVSAYIATQPDNPDNDSGTPALIMIVCGIILVVGGCWAL